jgi:hypothetical protein
MIQTKKMDAWIDTCIYFSTYFHSKLYEQQISKILGTCKPSMVFKTLLLSNFLYMLIQIFVTVSAIFVEHLMKK